MKLLCSFLTLLLVGLLVLPAASQQHSYRPKNGFVPDEKTAIRIAEAVLTAIYGEKQIKSEEPFSAKLRNGVWTVEGTIAAGVEGGTAIIKISKANGTIISVTHGM
jgi:NTF2 fold immunity protein